jgi:hypothetical protein
MVELNFHIIQLDTYLLKSNAIISHVELFPFPTKEKGPGCCKTFIHDGNSHQLMQINKNADGKD